ncbi:acyl carrier protein [bacterium]|nr:acyl carrier protein [bacterium]
MSNMQQSIRDYIVETFLFGQDDGFGNDDSFLEKGIIDSTGVLELVTHLESTYGVTVSDDELIPENLDSLSAVCTYVTRKQSASTTSAP